MSADRPRESDWFVRSLQDQNTHSGALVGGEVVTRCGVRFVPRLLAFGSEALPGLPADPAQVCPMCRRESGGGR